MSRLSVNLNKVALVRNSRGGRTPSLGDAVAVVVAAGCTGVTVHPREDERHIRLSDLREISDALAAYGAGIELNVEGDLRQELLAAAIQARANQFTFVPVMPGEITSTRGWCRSDDISALQSAVRIAKRSMRTSIFIDPVVEGVEIAKEVGADAVEIYTGNYAHEQGEARISILDTISDTAARARDAGLRVNVGHDLALDNMDLLMKRISPDEASIGHAIVSEAILVGLRTVVPQYLAAVEKRQ